MPISSPPPAPSPRAVAAVRGPTGTAAWTARVVVATHARRRPGRGAVVARVGVAARWSGTPQRLLVLGLAADGHGRRWLHVRLAARGARSGWIPADAAVVGRTRWRIDVDLDARTVLVRHAGRVRWRLRGVVGAPATPTPTGSFAVAERVRQRDPHGFYGPWIVFLTAYSDAVHWFDGNDGQIGLHGRGGASLRDPLGTARSHGCVRLTNHAIALIAQRVPDGTPVTVRR